MFEILSTCKGGGYMYCRTKPVHPKANSKGLYPLHRVIVENSLNRLLESFEDVHHKDEDKSNNQLNNLEVLTKAEHTKKHNKEIEKAVLTCPICKNIFYLKPHIYRLRLNRNKSNILYCSRKCGSTGVN